MPTLRPGRGAGSEVIENGCCLRLGDHRGQSGGIGFSHRLHAAEMFEQPPTRVLADSGYLEQFASAVAHLAPLAMKSDGEPVRLITDGLH